MNSIHTHRRTSDVFIFAEVFIGEWDEIHESSGQITRSIHGGAVRRCRVHATTATQKYGREG